MNRTNIPRKNLSPPKFAPGEFVGVLTPQVFYFTSRGVRGLPAPHHAMDRFGAAAESARSGKCGSREAVACKTTVGVLPIIVGVAGEAAGARDDRHTTRWGFSSTPDVVRGSRKEPPWPGMPCCAHNECCHDCEGLCFLYLSPAQIRVSRVR